MAVKTNINLVPAVTLIFNPFSEPVLMSPILMSPVNGGVSAISVPGIAVKILSGVAD